jgi:hypothetical protein
MQRPELKPNLAADEFIAFYWLKSELSAFCRTVGLVTTGSKQDLTQRIYDYLQIGKKPLTPPKPRPKTKMPQALSRDTVIAAGWRCSQDLRHFFEAEIGPQFHFNGTMRRFILQDGIDKTLQDAITIWHEEQAKPAEEKVIDGQFEYNRFIRAFFAENKNATLADAIAAWKAERSGKREDRGMAALINRETP